MRTVLKVLVPNAFGCHHMLLWRNLIKRTHVNRAGHNIRYAPPFAPAVCSLMVKMCSDFLLNVCLPICATQKGRAVNKRATTHLPQEVIDGYKVRELSSVQLFVLWALSFLYT